MVTPQVVDITRQMHRILLASEPERAQDYQHAAVMPGGADRQVAQPLASHGDPVGPAPQVRR